MQGGENPLAPIEPALAVTPAGFVRDPAWDEVPSSIELPAEPLKKRRSFYWLGLLLLTLFAGFIRIYWIDRPSLWNDEGHTFRRITGTYQDLLDLLQSAGFGPLHYELYWWMGHALGDPTKLTPFWMRIVPSLAGTFMVPAMYFLARQFFSKRVALLSAAFAACSAYMMAYSHDAKMYMHFWLFVTLNMACLFCWFRTNQRAAWLGWIAAGLAMCGLQAIGLLVLALQPVMLLTQRQMHWKKSVLFIIGMAIILAGPAGYYLGFNKYKDRVDESWGAAGLNWLPAVIDGRNGTDMLRFVTSAYLYSWEWPSDRYDSDREPSRRRNASFHSMLQGSDIDPRVLAGLEAAVVLILALVVFGAMPWSKKWRGAVNEPECEKWWRSALWLSLWIVVPMYGVYCYNYGPSISSIPKPSDWLDPVVSYFGDYCWLISTISVVLAGVCLLSRYIPLALMGVMLLALFISLWFAAWHGLHPPTAVVNDAWWRKVLRIGNAWGDSVYNPMFLWTIVLLAPAVSWYYSGKTIPERLWRTVQFALVTTSLYVLCVGVYIIVTNRPNPNNGPVWMPRYMAIVWPAFAVALCAMIMRLPTRPLRYLAITILLGTNLAQAWGRMFAGSEPPIDRIVRDIWDGQGARATVRAYVEREGSQSPHPAGGALNNNPGKYYMSIAAGKTWTPDQYVSGDVNFLADIWQGTNPRSIASDVRRLRQIERVIVWDRIAERPVVAATDPMTSALGTEWQRASEEFYPVRYHWNWSNLYIARRREYVKKPVAVTTQPIPNQKN